MAVSFAFHGANRAADASGQKADGLTKALASRVDVADGAASSALAADGWYRIAAHTASYVLISASATDGTNGEYWPAGQVETYFLEEGDKIGVSAA